MYVNAKLIPVETISGISERGLKENWRGENSSMMYGENFCKCHNVLPPRTTIKKNLTI
jgi:hypothetical protein